MMDLEEKVFPILKRGGVIVLPTEESARALARLYVKKTGEGLLASRCLSFDTFSALFISDDKDKRAADDFDRLLFSEGFVMRNAGSLSYFYNEEYPEIKNTLSSFINKMLPSLNEAFAKEIRNKSLLMDLSRIMDEYRAFLDSNGLYESGWAEYQDRELSEDYYLYHSEAFPKEIKLLDKVGSNKRIHTIEGEKAEGRLSVYKNEAQEIRVLFQNIRALIDDGVSLNRIAISTSAIDRLRPYLELESKLFDVPLYFVQGQKVACTPPGRFLKTLGDLYDKNYEIDVMKKLLLDPSFPLKDRKGAYDFISKAVSLSIKNAPSKGNDRYRQIDTGFYKELRRRLDALMTEKKAERILFRYDSLMDILFGDERFINSEINDKVYGFTADSLSRFVSRACELSLDIDKPLFPLFLSYIDSLIYVDRDKVKGISVYPFSQAAATPYDYHFLITLNESESAARIREASFLSEYERELFDEKDITDALIASYQGVTGTLFYSTSEDTYAGYALPLVSLMDNAERIYEIPSDPYQDEASMNRSHYIYPLQKKGYERASISAMRKTRRGLEVKGIADPFPRLSFSKISEYVKCPYRYALKYCYGLNKEQPYEIVLVDNLEIGRRLHSVLERFFRAGESDPKAIREYFISEMSAWKDGKRFSEDGTLKAMEFGAASASDELVLYIEAAFLENLESVAQEILEKSDVIEDGNEIEFQSNYDSFSLKGVADMVAASKSGDGLIIYDFKKGHSFTKKEIEEKKLQFSIYSMLMSRSERFSEKHVEEGDFVFLIDSKLVQAWKYNTQDEAGDEDLIRAVSDSIHNGIWSMSRDSNECSSCAFRGLCRRKFVIK